MNTREEMLEIIPKNTIGVEIGVFKGEFSDIILNIVNPKKLYLVDPWCGVIKSGDKNGLNVEYINGNEYFKNNILPKYNNDSRVEIIKSCSNELIKLDDNFFDWGYIDGDHSYEGVKYDLTLLRNKIKSGGIIMGHDYVLPRFEGVVKAVDEFCNKYNLHIKYLTKDGCPSFMIFNYKI